MTAKKTTVETTTHTTFTVPLDELLDAYVPAEERHKPCCTWLVHSSSSDSDMRTVHFVRLEVAAIAYDDEGRARLEEEREPTHDEP